jgi:hypothetical protein
MIRLPRRPLLIAVIVTLFGIGLLIADSGPNHQVKQAPPIQLGTSGGNVNNISKAFCCSGTLGSLVTKGGVNYILSNNHVLADADTASVGDPISQPGLIDVGCNANNAQIVANFSETRPLGTANVDAALAQVVNGEVATSGSILDVGIPSSTAVAATVGRGVAKSGRTTGLTCATVASVNTNVQVQYQKGCNSGKKFRISYTNQVLVNSSTFSAGGDSGSLIVTSDTAQPTALLYAGSSTTTIGNPIGDVTAALGVSFVGGRNHTVTCTAAAAAPAAVPSAAEVHRASIAKEIHAGRLMADPAVLGVGVGASEHNPTLAAVVIYVEQGRAHGPIPTQLNGVPTRVILTDAFRAFGWNEKPAQSCRVK